MDLSGCGRKERLHLVGCRESLGVVARQEPRLQFKDPVKADHQGHPVPCQLRLERHLVELRFAEGGEGRGSTLHGRDEALLDPDDVRGVAVLGFSGEVQRHLRLAPHRVEWIVPQQKARDNLIHTVASEGQITRLHRGAKGRPHEINRGLDRLRPESNRSHRVIDLRLVGDEAVLLDQVACQLGEATTLTVTVKDRARDKPEKGKAERGSVADPVLHTDLHHAARDQAK